MDHSLTTAKGSQTEHFEEGWVFRIEVADFARCLAGVCRIYSLEGDRGLSSEYHLLVVGALVFQRVGTCVDDLVLAL
jgi:hypothetical protein